MPTPIGMRVCSVASGPIHGPSTSSLRLLVDPVDADPVVVREAVVEGLDHALGGRVGARRLGDDRANDIQGVAVLDRALLGDGVAHCCDAQRSAQRSMPAIARRRSAPLCGERVLDPRRRLGHRAPIDQPLVLQQLQPLGEGGRVGAAQRVLQLAEALGPGPELAHDAEHPLLAQDRQRRGGSALGALGGRSSFGARTVGVAGMGNGARRPSGGGR